MIRFGFFILSFLIYIFPCAGENINVAHDKLATAYVEFMQHYIKRPLKDSEKATLGQEIIDFNKAQSIKNIIVIKNSWSEGSRILKTYPNSARAAWIRSTLISNSYFDDKTKPLTLKLLIEPDPVLITLPDYKVLMTRSDIKALFSLRAFALQKERPRLLKISNKTLMQFAKQLQTILRARKQPLPAFYQHAGMFWTGLNEHWSTLSKKDRAFVLKDLQIFVIKGAGFVDMPISLFTKLFGYPNSNQGAIAKLNYYSYYSLQTAARLSSHLDVIRLMDQMNRRLLNR